MALICDASFAAPGEAEDSVTLPWKSLTDNIYATLDDPNAGDVPQFRDRANTMNKYRFLLRILISKLDMYNFMVKNRCII